MRTLRLLSVSFIALALFGGGCFRIAPRVVQAPPASDEQNAIAAIGSLAIDQATASVTRDGQTYPAQDGVEILPGDTVEVTNGTVEVVYPDAGVSQLQAGSKVTFLPDGEGPGVVHAQVELTAGSIWTRFERLLGSDEKYSVSGNGVVATVRGTAFGVELVDGSADIQVADSDVDVSLLDARKDKNLAVKTIRLSAGEAIKTSVATIKRLDAVSLKKAVRRLSALEIKRKGYQFAQQRLSDKLLKRRATIRLQEAAFIPLQYRDRIDPVMLQRFMSVQQGFVAPTRVVAPSDLAPSVTPSQ